MAKIVAGSWQLNDPGREFKHALSASTSPDDPTGIGSALPQTSQEISMTDLTPQDFRAGFEALIGQAKNADIVSADFIDLPSDCVPWLDTGLELAADENLTAFAAGHTQLKGTELSFGADFQLWYRIGEAGSIFRGTRYSHSFTAQAPGRLYLASYFPGEWASRKGELATPPEVYQQVSGTLSVLLIRWRCPPLEGLQKLLGSGDVEGRVAGEIDRLLNPVPTPPGWEYLWFLGPAEIYRPCSEPDREHAICCHSHNDVGLLQKNLTLPLQPQTRLRWAWRMDQLPSKVREDTFPTHDYLSIAVEFDNGQDITYFWSSELPVGQGFRCPIPTWTARETHVVIRSGSERLGEWLEEERDVYRDYREYIGGELPGRIVKVWLIAVSFFQGLEGKCRYADIAFVTGDGSLVPVDSAG
jgi:hypothetical protein